MTAELPPIVDEVLAAVRARRAAPGAEVIIDLPDPTTPEARGRPGVTAPYDTDGLANLRAATSARLGVGRAGPRPRTGTLLLFQADHGVTQDAIYGTVDEEVKQRFGLFTVRTLVADHDEYLLRPDLGRQLSEDARRTITERCVPHPQVQIVVSDGLSAAAVNHNLPKIYPVIEQGLTLAGITLGTPFFVQHGRVGVINDVNATIGADVVLLLIGERPGLGIADALSAYLGWRPEPGKTDAHRDLLCMITDHGGTNPLEGGAYVVELVRRVLEHQASGVELRRKLAAEGAEAPPGVTAGEPDGNAPASDDLHAAVRAAVLEEMDEPPADLDEVIHEVLTRRPSMVSPP